MSEKMTSINLPGVFGSGLADWGEKSVAEMVDQVRAHARHHKEVAEAVLAAADSDFYVSTYRGVHVQRDRRVLQEGRKP